MKDTVVVTGGAGGLGVYVVKEFVRRNWNVVCLDKAHVACEGVRCVTVDLSDLAAVEGHCQEISAAERAIDVVVNLACSYHLARISEYTSSPDLVASTVMNLASPLLIVGKLTDALERSGAPLVINVSSVAADQAAFAAHYGMSKGAIESLTKAINEEFRINGKIRATTLKLGNVEVGLTTRADILGVTARPGKPVLQPVDVATTLVDLAERRSLMHVREIRLFPHKLNLRRAPE